MRGVLLSASLLPEEGRGGQLIQKVYFLDKTEQKSITWICSVRISNFYRGNCALTFFLGPAFSARPREFSSCLFSRLKFRFPTEETGLLLFFSIQLFQPDRGNSALVFFLGRSPDSATDQISRSSFSSVGLRISLPTNRANRSFGRYVFCKSYRPNEQIKLLLGRSPDRTYRLKGQIKLLLGKPPTEPTD